MTLNFLLTFLSAKENRVDRRSVNIKKILSLDQIEHKSDGGAFLFEGEI